MFSMLLFTIAFVWASCIQSKPQTTADASLASYLSDLADSEASMTSAESSVYSADMACTNVLSTCEPSIASCASSICQYCGILGIDPCCTTGDPTPTSCLNELMPEFNQGQGTTPPAVTPTDSPYDDSDYACLLQTESSSYCEVLTPGFTEMTDFSRQASCLCYDGATMWDPTGYDSYASLCGAYLSTASSAAYASFTSQQGQYPTAPCRDLGDIMSKGNPAMPAVQTKSAGSGGIVGVGGNGGKTTRTSQRASAVNVKPSGASSGRGSGLSAKNLFAPGTGFGVKVALSICAASTFALAVLL